MADWVDGFLRGPGGNLALADGLRLAPRRWEGPLWLPLTALTRCCGPEEQMEYVVEAESWERRLAGLAAHLASGGTSPPLLAQRRPEGLSVRDGNHRLGMLERLGATHAAVLVWTDLPDCGH
ncbi:hypothetical protein [Deinococcus radiopugnans]|uniref:hypothetical protein n=1 Tax=Deinococcus radiopugnans TaxID=57497 RepID=UPI000690AE22|nr:hypothetical protein [Deinococcus radiopugnans]